MKELKIIFILYIFSLPFTSAFAINAIGSLPIILSLLLFLIYSTGIFLRRFKLYTENTFFLFFWFLITLLSFFINDGGEKSSNHMILYFITVFCLYWTVRSIMLTIINVDIFFWKKMLYYLSIIVFISSLYGIVEFISVNFLNININNYIPHPLSEYEPLAIGYIRARSFVEESGHFVFFLEALAPLSIYYILSSPRNILIKIIYISVIVISIICTFSSFGFLSLLGSTVIFVFYYVTSLDRKVLSKYRILIKLGLILNIGIFTYFLFDLFFKIISSKMFGSSSYEHRFERVSHALDHLSGNDILFGYGPASYSLLNVDSYVSFFINVIMDSGFFGFLFFILFLLKQFVYILKIKNKSIRITFIISLSTTTLHYYFIGNYYYPWYWFLLAMIYTYFTYQKELNNL